MVSLVFWGFVISPIYPYALATPLRALVHVGEGSTEIVKGIEPAGHDLLVEVQGYGQAKTFHLKRVIHANLPLFLALATVGLFGVPWKQRLRFLIVGVLCLYVVHVADAWLRIRLAACDPGVVGDIAEVAFTNREAKIYDRLYSFVLFGRRFIPVALWIFGVARYQVIARMKPRS